MTDLQIGIAFPHAEIGTDPSAVRDFAQAADDLGFSHIHIYDHVLGANPGRNDGWSAEYTHETPFHEPFVLSAFMAATTRRIRFVTGVLILPQRQAVLVAKQAAELAILSGNRFALGVGTGWNRVEYEALGMDFDTRGQRMNEQVELIRALWAQPSLDFKGEFHRVEGAGMSPRPEAPIPIWFGGRAEVAVRRAARIGNGWFPLESPGPKLDAAMGRLKGYLREAGRQDDGFAICGYANGEPQDPERWRRQATAWSAGGATHISVRSTPPVLGAPRPGITVQYHIDFLRDYARAVFAGPTGDI